MLGRFEHVEKIVYIGRLAQTNAQLAAMLEGLAKRIRAMDADGIELIPGARSEGEFLWRTADPVLAAKHGMSDRYGPKARRAGSHEWDSLK